MAARRQYIRTKYLGPSDTRGSRIVAKYAGRTVSIPYPHEARNAHDEGAKRLLKKLGIAGCPVYVKEARGGRGNVYRIAHGKACRRS